MYVYDVEGTTNEGHNGEHQSKFESDRVIVDGTRNDNYDIFGHVNERSINHNNEDDNYNNSKYDDNDGNDDNDDNDEYLNERNLEERNICKYSRDQTTKRASPQYNGYRDTTPSYDNGYHQDSNYQSKSVNVADEYFTQNLDLRSNGNLNQHQRQHGSEEGVKNRLKVREDNDFFPKRLCSDGGDDNHNDDDDASYNDGDYGNNINVNANADCTSNAPNTKNNNKSNNDNDNNNNNNNNSNVHHQSRLEILLERHKNSRNNNSNNNNNNNSDSHRRNYEHLHLNSINENGCQKQNTAHRVDGDSMSISDNEHVYGHNHRQPMSIDRHRHIYRSDNRNVISKSDNRNNHVIANDSNDACRTQTSHLRNRQNQRFTEEAMGDNNDHDNDSNNNHSDDNNHNTANDNNDNDDSKNDYRQHQSRFDMLNLKDRERHSHLRNQSFIDNDNIYLTPQKTGPETNTGAENTCHRSYPELAINGSENPTPLSPLPPPISSFELKETEDLDKDGDKCDQYVYHNCQREKNDNYPKHGDDIDGKKVKQTNAKGHTMNDSFPSLDQ
eukprot:Awhi_evm1s2757